MSAQPAESTRLRKQFAAEGSVGLAWLLHARRVTSPGRRSVSFALVTSSCGCWVGTGWGREVGGSPGLPYPGSMSFWVH